METNKTFERLLRENSRYGFIIQPDYDNNKQREGFQCDLSSHVFDTEPLEEIPVVKKAQLLSTFDLDKKVKTLKPRSLDKVEWEYWSHQTIWCSVLLYYRGSNGKYWVFDADIIGTSRLDVPNLGELLKHCLHRYEPESKAFGSHRNQTLIEEEEKVFGAFDRAVKIQSWFAKELIKWRILQIEG